jgi:hypothetical protein
VDRIGLALRLGAGRHLATLLVAVDPLLLNTTAQPMTEVVFTALTTAWLWSVTRAGDDVPLSWRRFLLSGVLFGLAALCRPTIWPVAGLMVIAGAVVPNRFTWAQRATLILPILLGLLAVVSPWVIRNQIVFGRPILTTTHGGYTLLLANNPVYDREVVRQPWGATWSGESLSRWQAEVNQRMERQLGPGASEPARDAWMAGVAKEFIVQHPAAFFRAMLHRVVSLWSVTPRGEGRTLPNPVRFAVAAFYIAEYLAAAIGLGRLLRRRECAWWLPGLLLIVTIQGVHLAYWTDARMRAPLEPVLALLAARAWTMRAIRDAS